MPHTTSDNRRLDAWIWKACAGAAVHVPAVDSRVYFFPQGYLDNSHTPHSLLSNFALSKPLILCRLASINLHADRVTDEVFVKMTLVPLTSSSNNQTLSLLEPSRSCLTEFECGGELMKFAKMLTTSDANNGGGFSVPRFCADTIFPPLNYSADPPVQTLKVTDIHGVTWEFRHIFRGTPRRHLLTTGWSKFVNSKKLVAGDYVLFMKNVSGELFVGIRRGVKSTWNDPVGCVGDENWKGRGKAATESVVKAIERAAEGSQFEVVYYPKAGFCSDFVVKAEVVDASLNVPWSAGMPVKMAVETEDAARLTWFQGRVSAVSIPKCGPWLGSPWHMLQITWEEPTVLKNAKSVSPWQVEPGSPASPRDAASYNPGKRFKYAERSEFLQDENGRQFFTAAMAQSVNHKIFPAGMQGARQNSFSVFGFPSYYSEDSSLMFADGGFSNDISPRLTRVSTELNIGISQSDDLSPNSQSSEYSFAGEDAKDQNSGTTKVGIRSIRLFGQILQLEEPVNNEFVIESIEAVNNDTEVINAKTYTELLNPLELQCQGSPAYGTACFYE